MISPPAEGGKIEKGTSTTFPHLLKKNSHIKKGVKKMPTPPKPFKVLENEKKSHRTKAELALREKEEKKISSKNAMKMQPKTRENAVAAKEFRRIKKILESIEKDDALYEAVINRYCIIKAEAEGLEEKREELYQLIHRLDERYDSLEEEEGKADIFLRFVKEMNKLVANVARLDGSIQAKRKMLLDIEKENVMTVAAGLRNIPKKVEKDDPLLTILKGS